MSWSATGIVKVADGSVDFASVVWSPAFDEIKNGARYQAEFLINSVELAAEEGLVEGTYSMSLVGHWSTEPAERKSISMNLTAIAGDDPNPTN